MDKEQIISLYKSFLLLITFLIAGSFSEDLIHGIYQNDWGYVEQDIKELRTFQYLLGLSITPEGTRIIKDSFKLQDSDIYVDLIFNSTFKTTFLLTPTMRIDTGKVTTFIETQKHISPNSSVEFSKSIGTNNTLHVSICEGDSIEKANLFEAIQMYKLELSSSDNPDKRHQILRLPYFAGESGLNIEWAGDLNNDNAIDFIISYSTTYNGSLYLFMSDKDSGIMLVVRKSFGS